MLVSEEVTTKSYRGPLVSLREVQADKQRFNRLNKYVMNVSDEYSRRLLLNQLVIVFNTFKFGWACLMLEVYARDAIILGRYYAIMYELGFDTSGCDVDTHFLQTFREIIDENPRQKEIFRSFYRGSWW